MHKYVTVLKTSGRQVCLELPIEIGEGGPATIVNALNERKDLTPPEQLECMFWMASLVSLDALAAMETMIALTAISKGQMAVAQLAQEIAAMYMPA